MTSEVKCWVIVSKCDESEIHVGSLGYSPFAAWVSFLTINEHPSFNINKGATTRDVARVLPKWVGMFRARPAMVKVILQEKICQVV